MSNDSGNAPPVEPSEPTDLGPGGPSAEEAPGTAEGYRPGGTLLRGATVAPGLVLGTVHRKDYDLSRAGAVRVALDGVDNELNQFRGALDASRRQIVDLKSRLHGRVPEDDARILDTHLAYLRDSVFIADVENLILNEQMRLDAAIAKVVGDFDRIFRLVRSDSIRQSAVDLRDVGIRVLRNLEETGPQLEGTAGSTESTRDAYVLVANELSIVDMFTLANDHVKGIVTLEGGLTSHAAIFARAMRIPTLSGVEGLLDAVHEGDFVILDATEGILRVNPDDVVREQYASSSNDDDAIEIKGGGVERQVPEWALRPAATADGEAITVGASCGNLPEVEQALEYECAWIALYRTELLYLIDREPPSRDTLVHHYSSVIGAARGAPVTFRLLNLDSSAGLAYLHATAEANPSLGRAGTRALLDTPSVLRRQLQAILLASNGVDVRIALPFVTDCGDLRRVKEVLFEERIELRKTEAHFDERSGAVQIGVVVETPAAMLGARDLAAESDFLMVSMDSLQQYLLAADRDAPEHAAMFEVVHPFVLRGVAKIVAVARDAGVPVWMFGSSARRRESLPLLIGAGIRNFCVPPGELRTFLGQLDGIEAKAATAAARAAMDAACFDETRSLVSGFRHGYAPD